MNNDIELLRHYAETGSEEAFAELVRRHIDFVYAAAVRQANGVHRAEDVAQAVFTDLARKARTLCGRTELLGWLYVSTRYAALAVIRSEVRREARELEAHMMHELTTESEPLLDWATMRPMIDEALHELTEADRTAILRRFFRNDSLADIASALGVSEEAARKRVDRALGKLHALLARRGVTSTASALAVALSHQPVIAAPAGLATAVAGEALTDVSVAGVGKAPTTTVIGFMSISTIIVGAAALVTALTAGMELLNHYHTETIAATAALGRSAENPLVARTIATAAPTVAEQVKAMEDNLRKIAEARVQFQLENGRWPTSMADLMGPDKFIKGIVPVAGEDYSTISVTGHSFEPLQVVNPIGLVANYDPNRDPIVVGSSVNGPSPVSPAEAVMRQSSDILRRLDPALRRKAADAYRVTHKGQSPPAKDPRAIVPYFESVKDGADYLEYVDLWETAQQMAEPKVRWTPQAK